MNRFTDIEGTQKGLPPVYGYLSHQLLPFEKALQPILSEIDQLDRYGKIAKQECHFPSAHGLTKDESAAVFLYTMEWGKNSFYQVINRALRAEDRSKVKPWFAYLKLFDTALHKLPTVRSILWRGVKEDISKNFKKGDEFTWWTVSSCTKSVNILKNFLGPDSTLFLIEAVNGKDVSGYTNFTTESEVILCPGTRFRVIADPLDQPPIHIVHLQEVTDDFQEQPATSGHAILTVGAVPSPSSNSISNSQSIVVQTTVDELGNRYDKMIHVLYGRLYCYSGNRYEGEMKDGTRRGKGTLEYANGDKYTGIWVNNKKTGYGIHILTNGDRYELRYS